MNPNPNGMYGTGMGGMQNMNPNTNDMPRMNANAANVNAGGMNAMGANENGMYGMQGMNAKDGDAKDRMEGQAALRRQIEAIAFSILDLRLFLDTHPRDTAVIGLFNRYRGKYLVLIGEYERRYGPFNTNYDTSGNVWNWINNPWPWEFTAEG